MWFAKISTIFFQKREIEIQQKIEEEEENCHELKQVFASLQQEVDFKRDKLKRLYARLQSVKQEIKDCHEEYVRSRKDIEESNDQASMWVAFLLGPKWCYFIKCWM